MMLWRSGHNSVSIGSIGTGVLYYYLLSVFLSHGHVANASCEVTYVIGLEGVGHHGLSPVLRSLFQRAHNKKRSQNVDRIKISQNYFESFKLHAEQCEKEMKHCVTFIGGSFPNSRSPFTTKLKSQMRWNPSSEKHWKYLKAFGHPIDIERFFNYGSRFCKIRFILLHRNLVDAVWSHRTWDTGIRGHTEVLGMFAQYIEQHLQNLPDYAWKRIDYEDFWSERRDDVLKDLCKFLDWNVANPTLAFEESGFRLITTNIQIPCHTMKYLQSQQDVIFSPLLNFSSKGQHLGYEKVLTTFADSPRYNPKCVGDIFT